MPFRALFAAALMVCGSFHGLQVYADDEMADAESAPPVTTGRPAEKVGWLRPNTSHQNVDAPFAVVDSSGRVRCYVRPGEGVTLEEFSNKKVRVRGETLTAASAANPIVVVAEIGPPNMAPSGVAGSRRRPRAAGSQQNPVQQAGYQQPTPQAMTEELPPGVRTEADVIGPIPGTGGMAREPLWGEDYNGYDGGMWGQSSCGGPACGCGQPSCNSCCGRYCGPPGMTWVRAEYLYWWTQGMRVPPLVTTGPNAANPGYLDTPGTTILNGNNQVDGGGSSGGRITLGTWLNPCQTVGIEGDYFQLASTTSNYFASGSGATILSRPFFDTRPSLADQNVEQVAFPGSIQGSVAVDTYTRFLGAGLRMRFNICCSQGCFSNQCCPSMNGPGGYRLDFLLGYRYLRLADGVSVTENLTSLQPNLPGTFFINDSFTSVNNFNGIDFGALYQTYRGRWSLELIYRLALGNTNQLVTINGVTTTTQNGVSNTVPGGLLAQASNIGQYSRNTFGVVPELNGNLGYALTPRLRLIVGYTFIYWSSVARAGSQIDTDVNSTMLPNSPNPPTGDLRHPQFVFHEAPFWAQGINAGLDYRW